VTTLSSHALDLVRGLPAVGLQIRLFHESDLLVDHKTDRNGRWGPFPLIDGIKIYKLEVEIGQYFISKRTKLNTDHIFTSFDINVDVDDNCKHLHIPILLSPSGFTFYRGC